jgi:hypothetical protein
MQIIIKIFVKLFDYVFKIIEKSNSAYITIHKRPKLAIDIKTESDQLKQLPLVGIVLQGPILERDDFTLETIRVYKKHYPLAKIILSTWEGQDISQFKAEDIVVVLLKKPETSGISNVNYQIVSAQAGMLQANELGCKYVLKTRTDQRMYATNAIEYLLNLIKAFPIKVNCKQNERIVACGFNSFKYRLYGFSDMFYFGNIEDMLVYWSVALDQRDPVKIKKLHESNLSLLEYAKTEAVEVYLTANYLRAIGRDLQWTLKDSLQKYAEHFCFVDKESLDIYWPKYSNKEYRWLAYDKKDNSYEQIGFKDWFNLYVDLDNKISFNEEYITTDLAR